MNICISNAEHLKLTKSSKMLKNKFSQASFLPSIHSRKLFTSSAQSPPSARQASLAFLTSAQAATSSSPCLRTGTLLETSSVETLQGMMKLLWCGERRCVDRLVESSGLGSGESRGGSVQLASVVLYNCTLIGLYKCAQVCCCCCYWGQGCSRLSTRGDFLCRPVV